MKKVWLLLLFSFLIFGVLLSFTILLASGENNTTSNNTGINNSINNTINDSAVSNDTETNRSITDDKNNDACHEISGKTFRSVKQHENGLNVSSNGTTNGVVLGYWSVGFKNGHFSWTHSDIVEIGSYVCDGNMIIGNSTGGGKLTGSYNNENNILVWQGVEYRSMSDNKNERENKDENKTKIKTSEIITRGNCTIKIERQINIQDGKSVEVVNRKIKCADGVEAEVKIKVENRTEGGKVRERIKYEIRGKEIDVDAGDGVNLEEETNTTEYRLKARFGGNVTDIKIMPDQAAQIVLERLKALNLTNFTIELREIRHGNITRVVYNIRTNKHGKFLGIFKLKLKVEGQVDPVTGELLGTSKPWWDFLVLGEDFDQITGTNNETVNTTTPIIGFNETVNGTFNASG